MMRQPTACVTCRLAKRRCTKGDDQTKCYPCISNRSSCSLDRSPQITGVGRDGLPMPDPDHPSSPIFESYGRDAVIEMVRLYLNLIHDRPHSLFHVRTLWGSIESMSIAPHLLLSICAIGSRLSTDTATRGTAMQLTSNATTMLQSQIDHVSIETVQAFILLANICAAELKPKTEAMYFGIANRMAQILRLHCPDPSLDLVHQEVSRRVWWTLVMADNWCSTGLGIPRQLASGDGSELGLPLDERFFQSLVVGETVELPTAPYVEGLWAHMIHLVSLLGSIHDLNRCVAEGSVGQQDEDDRTTNLSARLDDWLLDLPDHLRENDQNLEIHRASGFGGPYIALHLGYHHYSTLLYFRYLDQYQSNPRTWPVERYAERCRWHATSFSRLLRLSRQTSGCEAVYATVGHMAVVSSSVLLHTLLTGEREELKLARHDLLANFEALIELKQYWPCLEHTMGRLLVFQEACQRTSASHRVDQWMVKFLTEHSLPLNRRMDLPTLGHRTSLTESSPSPTSYEATDAGKRIADQALLALFGKRPLPDIR